MAARTGPVPPRQPTQHEDDAIAHAELCIRVMERFLGAVDDDPKMSACYLDLLGLYMDVLQEELAPHAATLAY